MPGLMDLMGYRDDSDAPGLAQAQGGATMAGYAPGSGGAPMTAGPVNAAPMAAAPISQIPAAPTMGQAPTRGFWDHYRAGAVGPAYAESVYQDRVNNYRNQVIGGVLKNLFAGRNQDTPMTWQEVQQAAGNTDSSLLGNKKFLAGMGYIMQDWNGRIAQKTQNQFNTARMYGGTINDPTTIQNFNRFGYMTPGQGAAQGGQRGNQGGLMDMAPESGPVMAGGWGNVPGVTPRSFTMPKRSAKALAFPGAVNRNQANPNSLTIPRDADLKYSDLMRTEQGKNELALQTKRLGLPLEVLETRLKARVGEDEQTRGHQARRTFDQANPTGTYVTRTDSKTGNQYREWTGGATRHDLGNSYELGIKEAKEKDRISQDEQTRGHKERHAFDRDNPGGAYVTRTDPQTGRQYREWTGGATSHDLGQSPRTLSQMDADLVRRGFAAYGKGKHPKDVLNPGEYTRYENAMKSQSSLEEIAKLLFVGNKAGMADKTPQAEPLTEYDRKVLKNYPNAQKGPDGDWYVVQDGKRHRVAGN